MWKGLTMFNVENKWKLSFWILLGINIAMLLWLLSLVYIPTTNPSLPHQNKMEENRAEFTVMSTKQNLNQIINSYLRELSKNKNISYSVTLDKHVQLMGSIIAFDTKIPLTMTFTPIVQKNGDLILQQKSITLGRLQLPSKKVLKYIKDNYPMPDWIIVNPNKENIYVALTTVKSKGDLSVKAKQFNLEKNNISFEITVPHETIGIGQTWIRKVLR